MNTFFNRIRRACRVSQYVEDLAAALTEYNQVVEFTEQVWTQLREPSQPWNQTLMRLLDHHAWMRTAAIRVQALAGEMARQYGDDAKVAAVIGRLLVERGLDGHWNTEQPYQYLLTRAEDLITEHKARLAELRRLGTAA